MGIFIGYTSNLPTQLWIVARYFQVISFLISFLFYKRIKKVNYVFFCYGIIVAILMILIFNGFFPDCYIEGAGLTPFKIISEYVIITLLFISIILLYRNKEVFSKSILILLILSIFSTMISELSFTFYIGVYDFSNFVGHVFKIISFYFIYIGIIQIGLNNPINILFQKLKKREESLSEAYERTNFYKNLFAHDIRNIFQNILSVIELSAIEKGKSKNLNKVREQIKSQITKGKHLITNVIKITEIDQKDQEIKKIDVNNYLIDTIDYIKKSFPNKQIEINLNPYKRSPSVCANELLKDVFENLLINSIKYNLNEKVQIDINVSQYPKDNKFLKIEFLDNAMGISPEQREKLFTQTKIKTSEREGLGLGLTLVHKVIDYFEGDIWIEDRIEGDYTKGSKFIIILPECLET